MPVQLIDATLREGAQAPGVLFGEEDSRVIAKALAAAGVDAVECGHPAASPAEMRRVSAVARLGLGVPVLAHARADRRDIEAVAASGASWAGLFLGVNELSRRSRLPGRSFEELIATIRDAVGAARKLGLRVRFTVEDASRTPEGERDAAFAAALEAGADRLCFADTVGILEPAGAGAAIAGMLRVFPGAALEVHLHDDRGLALANALAAVDAGAAWVSCSFNGVGERCGIVDTAALLANLHARGERALVNPELLQDTARRVAAVTGIPVPASHPVTGAHAFTHRAKLHVAAIRRDPASYSWIDPGDVGRETKIAEEESSDRRDPPPD